MVSALSALDGSWHGLFADEFRGCSDCFNTHNHEYACFLAVR